MVSLGGEKLMVSLGGEREREGESWGMGRREC